MRVARVPARDALLEIFLPALIPAAPTILILYALRATLEPASVLSIAVIAAAGLAVYAIGYLGLEIRIRAQAARSHARLARSARPGDRCHVSRHLSLERFLKPLTYLASPDKFPLCLASSSAPV